MPAGRTLRRLAPVGLLILASCAAPDRGAGELESWDYRWGDSPRLADGTFVWLHQEEGWRSIERPLTPPYREGQTHAWYRARLPPREARDPTLLLTSIDLAAEVYVAGRPVYRWGAVTPRGGEPFQGWPWHLVSLPLGSEGAWLHVRVYSDYREIGLAGPTLAGERADILSHLWARDLPRLLVAAASLTLAVSLLMLSLLSPFRRRLPLVLALAIAALVVRVIARSHVKQLYLDAPLLWEYLAHASIFVMAIFTTGAVREVIRPWLQRTTAFLWIGLLALLLLSTVLPLLGVGRVIDGYPVYDLILIGAEAALFTLTAVAAIRGNQDARLFAVYFGVIGLLTAYALVASNGLLPWTDDLDYLIVFLFSVGLCVLIARRVLHMRRQLEEYDAAIRMQSERLRILNAELEHKVEERTRDLEHANRQLQAEKKVLQIVSITDALTGMHNRMYVLDRLRLAMSHADRYRESLSIVMLDLDHFKEVNDTWGHQAGDDVLRRVAGIFSATLRDSDLAGRYGGEEFLVVLPMADLVEAFHVAERLRTRIETLKIRAAENFLTTSGGIASYRGQDEESLLAEADRLLYRAKTLGRNRVEIPGPEPA
jgi:diguanylate cyclase (GGDEF)-like protein